MENHYNEGYMDALDAIEKAIDTSPGIGTAPDVKCYIKILRGTPCLEGREHNFHTHVGFGEFTTQKTCIYNCGTSNPELATNLT